MNQPFFETLMQATEAERQSMLNIPLLHDAAQGKISRETYLAFLEQAYHHVKHTVPLLMACGTRIDHSKEWLREACVEYVEEEVGHQEWILNDIKHAGGDAEAVRHGQPGFATEMMVSFAYDFVTRTNPVGFFGMVLVLEGTSTAMATQCAEAISASLGLKKSCFTYLNSHGALDIEHMKFFEGLMNRITDEADQQAVVHVAKHMYRLYGDVFRSIPHAAQETRHVA